LAEIFVSRNVISRRFL